MSFISAGRDDAVRVVRGWADGGSLVRVELHFGPVVVGLRGRVRAATGDEWRVVTGDGGELAVRLAADCTFAFTDIRDLPSDPHAFSQMVVVFWGDPGQPDGDHLSMAVITE